MDGYRVVVDKSTVPVAPRTVRAATRRRIASAVHIAFRRRLEPEFLKEGAAVEDFMRPDRIVIGATTMHATRSCDSSMRRSAQPRR